MGYSLPTMPTIDLHTHILPQRWPDWTARSGYAGWIELAHTSPGCARMRRREPDGSITTFREVHGNCWDPSVRLAEMTTSGVDVQVLSTVPVMFSYWAKPQDALDLARLLNDHIAGITQEHPTRFAGLGTLPMQSPELAVRELERCVRDLGFAGVQIGTNVNGRNLNDPSILEVLQAAQRLNAAVFVHPWDMVQHALVGGSGIHPAQAKSVVDRMSQYWTPWLVGMPAETCLAMCSVIFGGVLERLPTLRLCFAHGGGSFPGTLGRLTHGHACRPDLVAVDNPRPPRDSLAAPLAHAGRWSRSLRTPAQRSKLFVDSLVHEPIALRALIELFGPDRIALGSDYPFPLGEDPPGSLLRSLRNELGDEATAWMLGRTAIEFLTGDALAAESGRWTSGTPR